MSDVVVTLPQGTLDAWASEGDLPDEQWDGKTFYIWTLGKIIPRINAGERVYIVYQRHLIGYAPLVRIAQVAPQQFGLIRGGGAVAISIPQEIPGFRGYRYRWWERSEEYPIPVLGRLK